MTTGHTRFDPSLREILTFSQFFQQEPTYTLVIPTSKYHIHLNWYWNKEVRPTQVPVSLLPVDEGAFCVEQVELVIETAPRLDDGCRIGNHADGTLHRGQVATRHDGRRLVVDSDLIDSTSLSAHLRCLSRPFQSVHRPRRFEIVFFFFVSHFLPSFHLSWSPLEPGLDKFSMK